MKGKKTQKAAQRQLFNELYNLNVLEIKTKCKN